MYVIALTLAASMAALGLFHWALHTFGPGLTGIGGAVLIALIALAFKDKW